MADIDLKGLPRFIVVPKPGQTFDDIGCPHVLITRATVRDMTVFLLNVPDWVPPKCRETLSQMAGHDVPNCFECKTRVSRLLSKAHSRGLESPANNWEAAA